MREIVRCLFVLTCTIASALPAQAAPKLYGFGFTPASTDSSYSSFKRKFPTCVKVSATKFKAASRYAAGVAKFPKASATTKKANRACTQIGEKVLLGSVTVKTAPSAPSSAVAAVRSASTDTTSRCSIRVSSDGSRRVICEGMESSVSTTFDLPNGATLIETAPPGQALGFTKPGVLSDCRYQFVSSAGLVSCVDELQSITYTDTSALGSNGSLPTFQLLSTGDVVFIGGTSETSSAERLYKLSSSGVLTTLAARDTSTQSLLKFLVESGDRIVLVGQTVDLGSGDVAPFIWSVSATGVRTVVSADSRTAGGQALSFLAKGPAGNAILGLTNVYSTVGDPDTAKIVTVNSDSTLNNLISDSSTSPTYATDTFCAAPTTTRATFCNYGGTLITSAKASGDKMFLVGRSKEVGSNALPTATALFKVLPSLEEITLSSIAYPLFIGGNGGSTLIVSGLTSSAAYSIIALNTDTMTETSIATGLSAPLPFAYSIRNSMLVGYANAFPPTSLSVIQIPLTAGALGTPVTTEFPFSEGIPSTIRFSY